MPTDSNLPEGYAKLFHELKERIQRARFTAALAVNRELILLYWELGRSILTRQQSEGWGAQIVSRLSSDLRRDFPEMTGLSPRNLQYMRAFAEAYPNREFVQQVVAQIPWGHNIQLLQKISDAEQRQWYARQAIEQGWTRSVLTHQIEGCLYERQGKALTNFAKTLPAPDSELARQLLKDPYHFDFLSLGPQLLERDLERGLLEHLRSLILELGKGFAFVGSQYHLEVGNQDYYLDLLFYHLQLRCFVVIDLKIEDFKPEFAGKMNFYLSAVDDHLRHATDGPTIGIVLCKGRNQVIVEYALRDSNKPMGVAEYRLSPALPESLRAQLPTLEDFANKFPTLSILQLRADIERATWSLTVMHGLGTGSQRGIASMLFKLQDSGVALPPVEPFLEALGVLNEAIHSDKADSQTVEQATRVATDFLDQIKKRVSQ